MNQALSIKNIIEGKYQGTNTVYLAFCYDTNKEPKQYGELELSTEFHRWLFSKCEEYKKQNKINHFLLVEPRSEDFIAWVWDHVQDKRMGKR